MIKADELVVANVQSNPFKMPRALVRLDLHLTLKPNRETKSLPPPGLPISLLHCELHKACIREMKLENISNSLQSLPIVYKKQVPLIVTLKLRLEIINGSFMVKYVFSIDHIRECFPRKMDNDKTCFLIIEETYSNR